MGANTTRLRCAGQRDRNAAAAMDCNNCIGHYFATHNYIVSQSVSLPLHILYAPLFRGLSCLSVSSKTTTACSVRLLLISLLPCHIMLYALCTQKKPSSFSHSQWIYGELVSQGSLLCVNASVHLKRRSQSLLLQTISSSLNGLYYDDDQKFASSSSHHHPTTWTTLRPVHFLIWHISLSCSPALWYFLLHLLSFCLTVVGGWWSQPPSTAAAAHTLSFAPPASVTVVVERLQEQGRQPAIHSAGCYCCCS